MRLGGYEPVPDDLVCLYTVKNNNKKRVFCYTPLGVSQVV